MPTTFLTAT